MDSKTARNLLSPPPHLASPAAFLRWCRENPEGLRQMEQSARRMELGEFGEVSPDLRSVIRRSLGVRKILQDVAVQRGGILAEIGAMRDVFAQRSSSVSSAHLVAQLDVLEQRLRSGEEIGEEWAEFRLQFEAYEGELRGSIKKRAAKIAMSLDAHDRRDPGKFAHDDKVLAFLRQWRDQGMREQILGELPIAERRELEALEQILLGHMMAIAGEGNPIFRPVTMFDHGIDGEMEFRDNDGKAGGKRIYKSLRKFVPEPP